MKFVDRIDESAQLKLPFAKNYTIVPVLFLKNGAKEDAGNTLFQEKLSD